MRATPFFTLVLTMLIIALINNTLPSQTQEKETGVKQSKIKIPEALQIEHEVIHSTLVEGTKMPGKVGIAAKKLADVLDPHFVREEEIALPPLGLLAPLAAGSNLSTVKVSEVLAMTDSLKRELPKMLEEHKKIRAAVENLAEAAKEEKAIKYQELAHDLTIHAQNEEEIMYPAAILVGEIIRARGLDK